MSQELYRQCIDACVRAVTQCEMCLNNCLVSDVPHDFYRCMQLCRDCSSVCMLCLRLLSANSEFAQAVCAVCSSVCQSCADACADHAEVAEYFKSCAEACRTCAEQCAKIGRNEPAADNAEPRLFRLKDPTIKRRNLGT